MTTTTTLTVQRRRNNYKRKHNQNNKKKVEHKSIDKSDEEIKSNEVKTIEKVKKFKNLSDEVRKMFISTIDPYDSPLTWWEAEHVKYAINYPPVKSRLERIMGTHIVRLTDRKYMLHYMAKIIEDHEKLQKIRIEERKLAPPTIISQLLELSYKALVKKLAEPGYSKITLYM